MKIPQIRQTARSHRRYPKKAYVASAVILLISMGAGLAVRYSDDQQAVGTSQVKWPAGAFEKVELSGGIMKFNDRPSVVGLEKLAEMTALRRHSEMCDDVPTEWTTAFTILMMTRTPSEEQVVSQEQKMLALRDRIGGAKWCQLYAVEMEEAYEIYKIVTGH